MYKRKSAKFIRKKRRNRRIRRILPLLFLLTLLSGLFPGQSRQLLSGISVCTDTILSLLPVQMQAPLRSTSDQIQDIWLDVQSQAHTLLTRAGIHPASQNPASGSGSRNFQVHFLDVGEGLSVLVRSGEHTLLYDGGDRGASSFVVSYLQNQGITKLDYVVASHYDADHLNGLIGALHAFSVDTVLGPDYVHSSATYHSFLRALEEKNLAVIHPAVGDIYSLGDASFTILAPERITDEPNNNSIAIRLVNGQNSFLLSGDAQSESEDDMCRSGLTLHSDVICPGHHGSGDATSKQFLDYTQPSWAVISVGADNDYGHPHQETLRRLSDAGVTVLRTDELGTIVFLSDGTDITWYAEDI